MIVKEFFTIALKIKNIKPLTTGRDLIKIGFNQGKTIGEALDFILEDKIKNKDNFKTKEDEISFLEANFPKKQFFNLNFYNLQFLILIKPENINFVDFF